MSNQPDIAEVFEFINANGGSASFTDIQNFMDKKMNNQTEVIDVKWFSGVDCIGIVLVDTGYGHKAYIGVGRGDDEQEDIDYIAGNGSRFHFARLLWPNITNWAD